MVEVGIAQGFNQLSLTLFTAAAPAGALAFAAIAIVGITCISDIEQKERLRIFMIIPLLFAFFGLVASTNHLGRPANALFVLSGIGRSPLSNEVFAAVLFTGCGWLYWLLGFSDRFSVIKLRWLAVIAAVAAVAEVWFTANAYSVNTIATWSLPFTQINQIACALTGAGAITLFTLKLGWKQMPSALECRLLMGTLIVAVLGATVQVAQGFAFFGISSSMTSFAQAFPLYPLFIAGAIILVVGALAGALVATKRASSPLSRKATTLVLALVMAGILVSRFTFYCSYLTVGLS